MEVGRSSPLPRAPAAAGADAVHVPGVAVAPGVDHGGRIFADSQRGPLGDDKDMCVCVHV